MTQKDRRNLYECTCVLMQDLDEVSGKRRRYIVEIAKDLSGSDGNVRILDAGSASGNIGQWVRR